MTRKIIKKILDNGLTVILQEIHSAPIISQWLWYRVGSRNETIGKTGISHWCEHMQFKGTKKYPAGMLDREISRSGGTWNAFTFMDWTAFFETMPADKIDLAVDLESDRMRNCLYLPQEVESERTVVLSEMEGNENDPAFKLQEAVSKAAFPNHPYGRDVIGLEKDLLALTRDDLYTYYQTWYQPNNAVLTMAGDFNADEMMRKIDHAYQNIPSGNIPELTILPEMPLREEKHVQTHSPAEVPFMRIVWPISNGASADIYPITLLDSILTGPSSLNMFGSGSIGNRTSRLYHPLIESRIAAGFSGDYITTIDPFLYTVSIYLNAGHQPEEALHLVDQEIERITHDGIPQKELEKALKQAHALFAYSSDSITNCAYWLGYTEMFDDYTWFDRFVPSLESVTSAQIQDIIHKYFQKGSRVVGVCIPEPGDLDAEAQDE